MNSTREQLDKLQATERRSVAWAAFGSSVVIALVVGSFYVFHVPGTTREVIGTTVSFETHASGENLRVKSIINVQLDSGTTVRATIDSLVLAKPGSRVRLKATKMPIIGIEKFNFIGFEEKPAGIMDKVLR